MEKYLREFEGRIRHSMLSLCTEYGMLDGEQLLPDDVDARWEELALDYMADAVSQINEYPTVAVAWAGYLGMAVAHQWDDCWDKHRNDEYKSYYGANGFDDMDEYILSNTLGLPLDSEESKKIEEMLRRCAYSALTIIRHENIEPQSPLAYYTFARTVKTMYRIGTSMELYRLGYKHEKVNISCN